MKYKNQIICGHTLEVTKQLPDETFDTIITSCPYWGLRDYGESTNTIWDGDPNCKHEWNLKKTAITESHHGQGSSDSFHGKDRECWGDRGENVRPSGFCSLCGAWYGQLGLEPTLDLYLSHLWQITDELYRVLKKTGVMYWNHGDCYGGSGQGAQTGYGDYKRKNVIGTMQKAVTTSLTPKCLAMQNYRLILGMIDRGWILRNTIIWDKPNHMPSSVKDRFANSYEPVFMLTKNNKPQYYYNTKTGLMADKKPKKLIEGVDWDWRECPKCNGVGKVKEKICPRCKGTGKVKYSFWRSLSYFFDLDAVRQPHKDIQDYNRHAPFNYRVREAKKGHTGIIGVKSTEEEMERYNKKGQARGPEYKGKWKDNQKYMNELQQRINDIRASGVPHDIALSHPSGKNPGDLWKTDGYEVIVKDKDGIVFGGGNLPEELIAKIYECFLNEKGINAQGDLWTIPTQPFPAAHFATFPEKLIEPMILSSCPQWICKKCGKARVRITKKEYIGGKKETDIENYGTPNTGYAVKTERGFSGTKSNRAETIIQTIGWSDCGCNAGWGAGITFDPFMGSGTTGLVAKKLGRNYCGIELNPEYKKMADKRLMAIPDSLFK